MKNKIKNSPAMMTVIGKIRLHLSFSDDIKVAHEWDLEMKVALMAQRNGAIACTHAPKVDLLRMGALAWAWLKVMGLTDEMIGERLADERSRQRAAHAAGKFRIDVSDPTDPHYCKVSVLTEEIGEVAEAVDQYLTHRSSANIQHLLTELTQVLAVSVAWLESMEGQ